MKQFIQKIKIYNGNSKGQVVLSIILLTALIGLLSIMITQQLGRRQFRQLSQVDQIENTYYATESALYETLEHLTSDDTWPPDDNYTDTYDIDRVRIIRTIVKTINVDGDEVRDVTILGDLEGISRQVGGTIVLGNEGVVGFTEVAAMLSLDYSGSMKQGTRTPDMKGASKLFVDKLDPATDYAGFIPFGTEAELARELKLDDFEELKQQIDCYGNDPIVSPCYGWLGSTNIYEGLLFANDQIIAQNPPSTTKRVVILLSDGTPTQPILCCPATIPTPVPGYVTACVPTQAESAPFTSNIDWQTGILGAVTYIEPLNSSATITFPIAIPTGIPELETGLFEMRAYTNADDEWDRSILFRFNSEPDDIWRQLAALDVWGDPFLNDTVKSVLSPGITDTMTFSADGISQLKIDRFRVQPACSVQYALDEAQRSADNDIIIYSIGLGTEIDETLMQQMADITGGIYFYAPTSDMLDEIFSDVFDEIQNPTNVGFIIDEEIP